MVIVLFGPPASGKGTQAKKLAEKFNLKHISTGELFRKHIEQGTETGKRIDQRMRNGQLIDDGLTLQVLKEELGDRDDDVLLDGFPRTLNQAIALDDILRVDHVILLNADEKSIMDRVERRQRQDDDKIEHRLDDYFNKTIHTLKHYTPPVLKSVDGNGDSDKVFDNIVKKIQ